MSTRLRVALPILVLTAGCSDENAALNPQPATANTRLALADPNGMVSVGDFLLVYVNESEQGSTDLNGDGDDADNVAFLVDTATGTSTNLGLSGRHNRATDGSTFAWIVAEEDERNNSLAPGNDPADVNSDGDFSDNYLAVFDPAAPVGADNPRIFPTLLHPTLPVIGDDGYYAFAQSEALSDSADLNGDGDVDPDTPPDICVGVLDVDAGTVYQTAVAGNPDAVAYTLANGVLAFTGSEAATAEEAGGTDFNADADTSDVVLFVHQVGSGANVMVPMAVHPTSLTILGTPAEPFVLFAIDETNDTSNANQSGFAHDFDTDDMVAALFRVSDSATILPGGGVGVLPLRLTGSTTRAVLSAVEADNGLVPADLNEDGDSDDVVAVWVDLDSPLDVNATGIAQTSEDASAFPQMCGEYLLFLADESSQGVNGTNFNADVGDTDTDDTVLYFVDTSSGNSSTGTSLRVAANQMVCDPSTPPRWLVGVAPEADNGEMDLNSDGDASDEVPAYFPISAGGSIDPTLRVAVGGATSNSIVTDCPTTVTVFSFSEEGSGIYFGDVNVDLDQEDIVATAQKIDKANSQWGAEYYVGTIRSNEGDGGGGEGEEEEDTFTEFPFAVNAGTLAFPALESALGEGMDYNGDGDTTDYVLFYVNVTCD